MPTDTGHLENQALAVELLSASGEKPKAPPREVRIFVAGANRSRKGTFIFNERAAVLCQQAHLEIPTSIVQPYAFDWAHAMWDYAPPDPKASGEAAGWHTMAIRDGELWAVECEWSDEASEKILSRKWRFLSPVFRRDEEGVITLYSGAGLTNIPALYNAPTVAASARPPNQEHRPMKILLSLLGLNPETASEADGVKALQALQGKLSQPASSELLSQLGAKNEGEALGRLSAIIESAKQYETYKAQEADRTKAAEAKELEELLSSGIKSRKIAPAKEKEIRDNVSKYGIDWLRSFLSVASEIVPGLQQPGTRSAGNHAGGGAGSGGGAWTQLSNEEQDVCRQLARTVNETPEKFAEGYLAEKNRLNGIVLVRTPGQ